MAFMAGKLEWVSDDRGVIHTWQGIVIPISSQLSKSAIGDLPDGTQVVCEVCHQKNDLHLPFEAMDVFDLQNVMDDGTLLACISRVDKKLLEKILNELPSSPVVEKIRKLAYSKANETAYDRFLRSEKEPYFTQAELDDFFTCVAECIKTPVHPIRWPVFEALSFVTPDDELLAEKWIPPNPVDFESLKAKMLSARIAEKVAQAFYTNLGHPSVEDIAITQLKGQGEEWKTCDISLDHKLYVDVKNARSPANNKIHYVDYCVPSFKMGRNNEDVIIAGVYSPYLKLKHLLQEELFSPEVHDIVFLGETTLTKIKDLELLFSSPKLKIKIADRIKISDDPTLASLQGIVPAWAFDYPDRFYEGIIDKREKIKQYDLTKLPPKEYWPERSSPVPALVACKMKIPQKWTGFSNTQRGFLERLYKKSGERIDLPTLYLSILSDFVEKVSTPKLQNNYSPKQFYWPLVFTSNDGYTPAGISDPLYFIKGIITTLESLWNHRSLIDWDSIQGYVFKGMGLLNAITKEGKTITLLAYCGGKNAIRGKCGYSPLIYRGNNVCPHGKLICDKCKYCCEKCRPQIDVPLA